MLPFHSVEEIDATEKPKLLIICADFKPAFMHHRIEQKELHAN